MDRSRACGWGDDIMADDGTIRVSGRGAGELPPGLEYRAVRRPESVDSDCRPLLQIGIYKVLTNSLASDRDVVRLTYKAALYYIGMPLRMTYSFVRCSYNWPPFEQQKPF
ncbi:uncharacterized protein An07g07070 [Aspergillus niger]|uniref:Contig An07c0200, genomic contig n=2 Tax=Aspergillus niger TaxID=5061 RepID=A2QNU7_ASPNC|nr:uncharacterized protein An07g07070 [Aspergillus niger]CAK39549.1 unnamed protein product [Aspergillus niger]